MKKQTKKYLEGTFGRVKVVKDFLPFPEELKNAPVVMRVDAPVPLELYNCRVCEEAKNINRRSDWKVY